jgi:hypothetical protein
VNSRSRVFREASGFPGSSSPLQRRYRTPPPNPANESARVAADARQARSKLHIQEQAQVGFGRQFTRVHGLFGDFHHLAQMRHVEPLGEMLAELRVVLDRAQNASRHKSMLALKKLPARDGIFPKAMQRRSALRHPYVLPLHVKERIHQQRFLGIPLPIDRRGTNSGPRGDPLRRDLGSGNFDGPLSG